jgi:hypothetical protein
LYLTAHCLEYSKVKKQWGKSHNEPWKLASMMLNSSLAWVIKSQALAYFIAKWTDLGLWGIGDLLDHWVMYFDGSYTLKGAGAGIVLIPPEGDMLKYVIQIEFPATNNTTEYEELVTGLWLAKELGIR